MKTGRNESCPCGSGLKYKHCCEGIKPWYKEPRWIGAHRRRDFSTILLPTESLATRHLATLPCTRMDREERSVYDVRYRSSLVSRNKLAL